jgi:hypothetical protein
MAALEKKEILDELNKLGIDTLSERNAYLEEYTEYYASLYKITEGKCKLALKDMIRKIIYIPKKSKF